MGVGLIQRDECSWRGISQHLFRQHCLAAGTLGVEGHLLWGSGAVFGETLDLAEALMFMSVWRARKMSRRFLKSVRKSRHFNLHMLVGGLKCHTRLELKSLNVAKYQDGGLLTKRSYT